jgi:hypothetical protein
MSGANADQLRDEINHKLATNGYGTKLKSIQITNQHGNSKTGVGSMEISHEFEKGYLSETEMVRANLFVSRLIREVLG